MSRLGTCSRRERDTSYQAPFTRMPHQTSRTGDDRQGETATRRMRSRRTNKVFILSPGFNQSVGLFAGSRYIPSTHGAVDNCRGDDANSQTKKGLVGIP